MRLKILVAAALGALSLQGALAANLLGVYRDAQESDPAWQAARSSYTAGQERLPQARAGYLPNLSLSGTAYNIDSTRNGIPDQNFNATTYTVSLTQPLFRWQNWIAIDQAKQQLLQNEAGLETARQDLILRVSQAYFDVLLAQDNVALSGAQKVAISEQLAQAKRNFEVGTATIVDTLEAQASYDQAVAKEIADLNDLEVKRQALRQIIGKVPDTLTPLREPLKLNEPKPNRIEEWVNSAADASYSVAVSRAAFEIAKQQVDSARAGHYPTLDLNASYTGNRNPSSTLGSLVSGISPYAETGQVGILLSIPLYAGGATQSKVREALALRDKAEQDLETTRRAVAQSVRQNFLFVTNGITGVAALERALTSAQSKLDSTILGRDVGVRTSVDVLNAQQQLFQTRRDLQQVRYGFLMNTLRLKASAGILNETDLEEVNRTLGGN
jgi:outer membrane protein